MPPKTKAPSKKTAIKKNESISPLPEKPLNKKVNLVWLLAGIVVLGVIIFAGIALKNANIAQNPTATKTILPTATSSLGIGSTMVSVKDGMTLMYVPAGEFLMGSADTDPDALPEEKPQHKVYLDAFWIDKTEITEAMYTKCEEAGICKPQSVPMVSEKHPARGITWYDATTYCEWVGRRLLTEAEWEKAARGTDGRIYPWGNQQPTSEMGNFYAHEGYTVEAGRFPAGASPYGVLDMAGNAWEWIADRFDENYYKNSPDRNPTGPKAGLGMGHVLRGGIYSNRLWSIRSAVRNSTPSDTGFDSYGIRCGL